MFRVRWLSSLLKTSSNRKDRRLAARNRKPIRLVLESLEDRLTPSGPQTAGSYIELVNAVAADTAANTHYVIQISKSFQYNSGGQVSISKLGSGSTLTIEGQNGTDFTLTGNGNRLFTIGSGQNVTFADLTLTGGSVTSSKGNAQGGAILDHGGNVRLSKVIVQGNTVKGGTAEGGGVYASGAGTLTIRDSILSNNSAQGVRGADGATLSHGNPALLNGGIGGSASGGGLYVGGSGWTVTLLGDTFAGNTALGGNGGNGSRGANVPPAPPLQDVGDGGFGGWGGSAEGGAAFFTDRGPTSNTANTRLTILDDPAAPTAYPSLFVDNTAQAGVGGNGGDGGTSVGTANNFPGGYGGHGGNAEGGALVVTGTQPSPPPQPPTDPGDNSIPFTVGIGNTTFYGNTASSNRGGQGGAAGSGGRGKPGAPGLNGIGGSASGGGLELLENGTNTVFNCTVANNTAVALGTGYDGYVTKASGGGISAGYGGTFDNNTITQNTVNGAMVVEGSGIDASYGYFGAANLFNNIIQGNRSVGSSAFDLGLYNNGYARTSASNNFIATMNPNAVSTSTNIVGSTQVQLGKAVGVDANGNPTGGPIYYPLLSGTASINAGSSSVLNTIAGVEGTTSANTTDELGKSRSSNGSIHLGAVQTVTPISSYPLILTGNPANPTVYAGSTASFTASASGHPTPTVYWQISTNGGETWNDISGVTGTTLTLDNVTLAMSGDEYQAVFTNSSGSVTSGVATLTVNPGSPPVITGSPNSQIVTAGQTADFTASASGGPPPTVQWQVSSDGGKTWTNISGAVSTMLALEDVTAIMNGDEYRAVFTNSSGSVASAAATLTVNPAPPPPPVLNVPPLLAFLDELLGSTETMNADGTETITDSLFGIPLVVSTFDAQGNLVSATLFGFTIPNWVWSM